MVGSDYIRERREKVETAERAEAASREVYIVVSCTGSSF